MTLIANGFAPTEVRGFSFPKLKLWSGLAEERELQMALQLSAAVWDPQKVAEHAERIARRGQAKACTTNESETPLSWEEFQKLVES